MRFVDKNLGKNSPSNSTGNERFMKNGGILYAHLFAKILITLSALWV